MHLRILLGFWKLANYVLKALHRSKLFLKYQKITIWKDRANYFYLSKKCLNFVEQSVSNRFENNILGFHIKKWGIHHILLTRGNFIAYLRVKKQSRWQLTILQRTPTICKTTIEFREWGFAFIKCWKTPKYNSYFMGLVSGFFFALRLQSLLF